MTQLPKMRSFLAVKEILNAMKSDARVTVDHVKHVVFFSPREN